MEHMVDNFDYFKNLKYMYTVLITRDIATIATPYFKNLINEIG